MICKENETQETQYFICEMIDLLLDSSKIMIRKRMIEGYKFPEYNFSFCLHNRHYYHYSLALDHFKLK